MRRHRRDGSGTRRTWAARVTAFALATAACGTITPASVSLAPRNSCAQDRDCTPYQQNGPVLVCPAGACEVGGGEAGNWTFIIQLPSSENNGFSSQTYAIPYGSLAQLTPPATATGLASTCPLRGCAQLPQPAPVTGELDCTNAGAGFAKFYLGGVTVALPVQATFRPVFSSTSATTDAVTAGLPLLGVQARNVVVASPPAGALLGPGGGPLVEYNVPQGLPALSSPLTYERTLQPLPPFDQAYPPDVLSPYTPGAGSLQEQVPFNGFDTTVGTDPTGQTTFPTFNFQRADGGPLDGWTAYLRDVNTLRRFSQTAKLSGTLDSGVMLLTSHHPPKVAGHQDALTNAQLVVAPPPGSPMPTWLFTPIGGSLAGDGTYPKLPPPVTTTVTVLGKNKTPVSADLIFEAIDICRYETGGSSPVPDELSANHDFSYVLYVPHGSAPAKVTLPLGTFRVTASPVNSEDGLTVLPNFSLADNHCNPVTASPVFLAQQSVVSGTAQLANQEPLAGATVEFLPTACTNGDVDSACLPRPGSVTTAPDGTFSTQLDQGAYRMTVRPAGGTAWPWHVQPLQVTSSAPTMAGTITIPAPIYAGLRLFDWDAVPNPLPDVLVRVFDNPATGSPYEIGEALTDSQGHFDMYLDPSAQ